MIKYNDNIDVNLFQYFTRATGSSEMHLKKIDVVSDKNNRSNDANLFFKRISLEPAALVKY